MLRVTVLHHLFDESLGGGRRDDCIALEYSTNRIEQRLRFGVLEQEARSTGGDGRHHILVQIERRQNDYARRPVVSRFGRDGRVGGRAGRIGRVARRGGERGNTARGLNAVHAGHAHIHQHHVGMQGFRQRHGLGAVGRLPDHLHIRLRTNDHGKTGTHQLLVVRNNHANASALVHALHCIRFLSERRSINTLIVP